MKKLLVLAAVVIFSVTGSAAQAAPAAPYNLYFGKVGQLILDAMKGAGVKPACDQGGCTFTITDFDSYVETDTCGGGTTGYGTSFKYSDGTKYDNSYCTGGDVPDVPPQDAVSGLVEVFGDLGLSRTAGWTSSIRLSKAECVTVPEAGSAEGVIANCQLTFDSK